MKYLFFLLSLSLSLSASKIEFRDLSFKEGMAAAAEEGKPVFIDCYTTWCGPCKWMSANIFTDSKVADYYNENYVCLKIDMEKGEGIDIAKDYGIRAYPTLLYLNAEGERLLVTVGASRVPQDYIDAGEQAKDPERNLPYLLANKEENFDNASFMKEYFKTASKANMLDENDVDRYFENIEIEEWAEDDNWEIITNSVSNANSNVFKRALAKAELFIDEQGAEAQEFFERTVFYALANTLYRARNEEQMKMYRSLREELLSIDFPGSKKVALNLDLMEHEKNEDYDAYAQTAIKNVRNVMWEDAQQLNSISWTIYQNVDDPEANIAAEEWAARAVELDDSHHILDTYAHLLFKNGYPEKALKVETAALDKAKEEGVDTEDYESFIAEMTAQ